MSSSSAGVVTVKVFADLRKLVPAESALPVEKPEPVTAVLARLGIPKHKAAITLCNARHVELTDTVQPGDTLAIFPPVGGG